jgi:hypothetical protein
MASTARVVTAVGGALIGVALIAGFIFEGYLYGEPNIDSTALTAALITGAVLFGSLAAVGFYMGLRLARIRELPYRFGVHLAFAYIVVVTLIGLVPAPLTIELGKSLDVFTLLLLPIFCAIALPGVLAYALARLSLPRIP